MAETFTASEMSPANREALEAIADTIDGELLGALVEGRRIDRARARALVDGGPYLAAEARAGGLLDGVLYRDQVAAHLGVEGQGRQSGLLQGPTGKEARTMEAASWLRTRPRWLRLGMPRRKVAVLTLGGTIVPGEGASMLQETCGATPSVRALDRLREDHRVAAVVLHVDSRGGSSAASDLIWRGVARLGAAKPVVAYFGDVAASGGYYIAVPCAWIVAQRATLTGSIGVIAGKMSLERLLGRLGVGTGLITRGRAAAMNSVRRRYDDAERERLRAEIAGVYRQFVEKVAAGRKRTTDAIDAVAQGRVWTGEAAAERGLVDALGAIGEAVRAAEERARRKPGERFDLVDAVPRPKAGGLLRSLRHLDAALAPWRALSRERALCYADEVPDIS